MALHCIISEINGILVERYDFYREMLCIAWTMLSQGVSLSVTRRYSVETVAYIRNFLSYQAATLF